MMSVPGVINNQNVTVQKYDFWPNDYSWLKGAVARPFSGPADSGKPKWATLIRIKISF